MNLFQRWIAPLLILVLTALSVGAQVTPYTSNAIQAIPPNIAGRDFPAMMMLAASRDHTLFGPMYTDYEDLTGSGRINPTYVPTFEYYGYFDPSKCYGYDGSKFVPKAIRHAKNWCSGVAGGRWSGNFLNWASMSRIDVVRKMLYGGSRFVDEPNSTVLQTALLGSDAHAFAKYYRGEDIALYTPFTTKHLVDANGAYVGLTTCAMSYAPSDDKLDPTLPQYGVPTLRMVKGNYLLWSTSAMRVCQWRPVEDPFAAANNNHWFGTKLVQYFKRDAAIANSDLAGTPDHGAISPFPNIFTLPPAVTEDGLTFVSDKGLHLRVRACVDGLVGKENCKRFEYDEAGQKKYSLKPVGILQDYGWASSAGDHARAEFGLISGSYDKPLSGGVLRKNVGNLNDEINPDGTFCHLVADTKKSPDCSATGGLIKSFDAFRLFAAGLQQRYSKTGFTWLQPSELEADQARFPSWGNPVGEMLLQALSYFAGKGVPAGLADGYDAKEVGLPSSSWVDPFNDALPVVGAGKQNRRAIYGRSVCRPLNMLAISSSALSFDRDAAAYNQLPNTGGKSLADFTNAVGVSEGINGSIRSVAKVDGGWGFDCSGKQVTLLSDVTGVCPEAPATQGGFMAAGAALYGNTRAVRSVDGDSTDLPDYPSKADLPKDLPAYALRVKTLAAAMGGGVARIEVVHPTTGAVAYITPASMWKASTKLISGALLTIKLLNSESDPITKKTIAASYVVTWNDAQFGGDYDMDIVGYLSYRIDGNLIKVTSDILNVDAGMPGSHGFSIVGAVSNPGLHITHSANGLDYGDCADLKGKPEFALRCGFKDAGMPTMAQAQTATYDNWNWPTTFNGEKVGFGYVETATTKVFTFDPAAKGAVLQDPLWYAAKYGSFTTGETSFASAFDFAGKLPKADAPSDGYFLARDPAKLELGLRRALDKLLAAGNSTPAVSTAQLISTSLKYVAEFDAKAQTGTVKAYGLTKGQFNTDPSFELGQKLTDASRPDDKRQVITDDGINGVAFTVSALSNSSNAALTSYRQALAAGQGNDAWMEMVSYARGGTAPEGLRPRLSNVMGPIVNATPWLQRGALLRTTDVDLPSDWASYRDFAVDRAGKSNQDILWVASNDSMLHAFNAKDGSPVMSYLPSQLVGGYRAAHLATNSEVTATLDGSPFTGDVYVSGAWHTYLFSSLGRGGKGVFALDVTDTSNQALNQIRAASVFKWNFTEQDDADLGYILIDPVIHRASGQPSNIVRTNDGKFRLLLPNGYGSSSGRAVVFLLDLAGRDGSDGWKGRYHSLVPLADDSDNGMMGATWVDIDNNGTADWIYATDLKGRLWKFDVSSSDPSKWRSSFVDAKSQSVPMYEARSGANGDGQPLAITTSPVVTYPGLGGVMIGFGTGKAITSSDFPRTDLTQRMYMIWDKGNYAADLSAPSAKDKRKLPSHVTLLGRQLVRNEETQQVTIKADDSSNVSELDWLVHDGWYLDFPVAAKQEVGTGEMILSTPVVRSGIVFFTSVRPQTDQDLCQTAPIAAIYAVAPVSGKAVKGLLPGVDTIGMLIGDSKILVVSDQTSETNDPTQETLRVIRRDGDMKLYPSASSGRIQWRVVPGLKTY